MFRGRAANLASRRSSFRRCPSGDAQYCAGVSRPVTPACFLFLMCIDISNAVVFVIVTPAFSFFPI